MIDLKSDYIKRLPNISSEDSLFMGYWDSYDYWLVFEEGEFRVYSYEYWSYDSIVDGEHEDETWRDDCCIYFKCADGCFDKDTCEYMPLKFENNNPESMAFELWEATKDMEDNSYITIDDGPTDKLIDFIARHTTGRVYCYYK